MVFDLNRQPFVGGVQRGSARDRPGLEDPIELEPEVIVETPRRVLLDDEAQSLARGDGIRPAGLRGFLEIAFRAVYR
jgi:hypothetical protein